MDKLDEYELGKFQELKDALALKQEDWPPAHYNLLKEISLINLAPLMGSLIVFPFHPEQKRGTLVIPGGEDSKHNFGFVLAVSPNIDWRDGIEVTKGDFIIYGQGYFKGAMNIAGYELENIDANGALALLPKSILGSISMKASPITIFNEDSMPSRPGGWDEQKKQQNQDKDPEK